MKVLYSGFGRNVHKVTRVAISDAIRSLIQERETARASKDWAQADRLRNQLVELGYEVQDKQKS